MSMDPPKVLLERSFLEAVAQPEHADHRSCTELYRHLVAQFQRQEILLVAVGDHLRSIEHGDDLTTGARVKWFLHRAHKGLFAPVDALYVGFQHRRAAAATGGTDTDTDTDTDRTVAMTLVMCSRHRVRRVVTTNPAYERYELELAHPDPAPE